jgi:alkanesulfonate monooxygenase SsuD/methylene tetrahydromethanopterin reductase-like flavin-dependent oxidoreductase (luciferase family)
VVAALGPRMLDLAGRYADGTVTWMTGRRALADHVVPRLRDSAAHADRVAPRVIAGLPVCVTDDVEGARARVDDAMAGPATMPSYRRMLEAEGAARPSEISLIGNEDRIAALLDGLGDAGATELLANVMGTDDEKSRTRAFLASLPAD